MNEEKFAIIDDYLYIYVDGMYNRVANYSTDRDKEDKFYLVDLLNEQVKENEHLEHNWNELKSWLKKTLEYEQPSINTILDKIKELEEGENNDC